MACILGSLSSGCGGSSPEPQYPEEAVGGEEASDPTWETGDEYSADSEQAPADDAATASPATGERKEPVFTEGMTVEQAIGAVPSHYDYIGLDQDVLAKPLTQIETYKECNVKQSDKFAVRIAVWDGKVVGADVKSPNQALQQCIDRVVRQLEYKDKVESINTVEYTF